MATATATLSSTFIPKGTESFSSLKSSVVGATVSCPKVSVKSGDLICKAAKSEDESVSRRATLTFLAGVAALSLKPSDAEAAYGESANIFGPAKKSTGFVTYEGNGFKLDIPSKWNPSKEREFPGMVLRFEDNFDATNNLSVLVQPAKKGSISDYGSPEDFLKEFSYLLGQTAYNGKTISEGGFEPNAVATASVLESSSPSINGKTYFKLSVLTRTADGDEGGKHQLITATVSDGKLFVLKTQAGDKRWFKGVKKFVEGTDKSFQVA